MRTTTPEPVNSDSALAVEVLPQAKAIVAIKASTLRMRMVGAMDLWLISPRLSGTSAGSGDYRVGANRSGHG